MDLMKIEIPNFAREIQVTVARRSTYYYKGEKIPKKYMLLNYAFLEMPKSKRLALFDLRTKCPVIKNPTTAGTPRFEGINGNDVWNTHRIGNYTEKIKLSIQNYFWEVIKHFKLNTSTILRDKIPLRIHLEFYTYKENQDIDNLDLFYRKAFADAIQDRHENFTKYDVGARLIANDGPKIVKSFYTDHHDCKLGEDKLVITVSLCDNTILDYNKEELLKININDIQRKSNQ